ncbi:Uncharacterised protein [Mycobacteroides abscessus subsp. abscessus]|nr:Uncharacterised protein [Mycobacteroides abscessus subsp. abscessus]
MPPMTVSTNHAIIHNPLRKPMSRMPETMPRAAAAMIANSWKLNALAAWLRAKEPFSETA